MFVITKNRLIIPNIKYFKFYWYVKQHKIVNFEFPWTMVQSAHDIHSYVAISTRNTIKSCHDNSVMGRIRYIEHGGTKMFTRRLVKWSFAFCIKNLIIYIIIISLPLLSPVCCFWSFSKFFRETIYRRHAYVISAEICRNKTYSCLVSIIMSGMQ